MLYLFSFFGMLIVEMTKNDIPAISIQDLTKEFGSKTVIHPTNLTIAPGKIYTLIGPNGTGKTTLIKMLVGLLSPTTGEIRIFGNDIVKDPTEAKKIFSYISDDPSAYEYLTGYEFIALTGNLRGMSKHDIEQRMKVVETLFPIKDILTQSMAYYSRGNRQKVALLAALLSEPKILFIDEPIVGLDPTSMDTFGKTLQDFKAKNGTVFFSTHTLQFADIYADYVYVMDHGTITKQTAITKEIPLKKIYSETILE